ncbi:hypothetical protein Ciccas_010567 [Cichlidogyrus casuarinus]|uniref:Uncharacterized protein n=1 Tax=Cichlidogyrus casuarinus TaxID=1844966 RepID=A0ABD2PTR4_9PLAT
MEQLQAMDLAPSEKYDRVKKWYSTELDRIQFWKLTIGSPLAIRTHHYAAGISRPVNSAQVLQYEKYTF